MLLLQESCGIKPSSQTQRQMLHSSRCKSSCRPHEFRSRLLEDLILTLSLSDQLNVHNVLEHDASLSREDAFFGNNHVFNQTVFSTSTAYWTETVLLPQHIADSKLARQITSRNTNPEYRFTTSIENFSIGEVGVFRAFFFSTELPFPPHSPQAYF